VRKDLIFLTFILACTSFGSAYADKNTTCEAYALSVMAQIKQAAKHEECSARGFFRGDRWQNDFNHHFNACGERYNAETLAHRAFTQGEKQARERELSKCIDKISDSDEHGKDRGKQKDRLELTAAFY
jgi:hypothetical protein